MKVLTYTWYGKQYTKGIVEWCRNNPLPQQFKHYATVSVHTTQNGIRRHISIVHKYGGGVPCCDLSVSYDPIHKEYRLWAYEANWLGRASYYAGMIVVREQQLARRKRRKARFTGAV